MRVQFREESDIDLLAFLPRFSVLLRGVGNADGSCVAGVENQRVQVHGQVEGGLPGGEIVLVEPEAVAERRHFSGRQAHLAHDVGHRGIEPGALGRIPVRLVAPALPDARVHMPVAGAVKAGLHAVVDALARLRAVQSREPVEREQVGVFELDGQIVFHGEFVGVGAVPAQHDLRPRLDRELQVLHAAGQQIAPAGRDPGQQAGIVVIRGWVLVLAHEVPMREVRPQAGAGFQPMAAVGEPLQPPAALKRHALVFVFPSAVQGGARGPQRPGAVRRRVALPFIEEFRTGQRRGVAGYAPAQFLHVEHADTRIGPVEEALRFGEARQCLAAVQPDQVEIAVVRGAVELAPKPPVVACMRLALEADMPARPASGPLFRFLVERRKAAGQLEAAPVEQLPVFAGAHETALAGDDRDEGRVPVRRDIPEPRRFDPGAEVAAVPDRRRQKTGLAGHLRVRMAEIGAVEHRHAPHLQHGVPVGHLLLDPVMGDAAGLYLPEGRLGRIIAAGLAGGIHGLVEFGPRSALQLAPACRQPRTGVEPGLELLDEAVSEVVRKLHRLGEQHLAVRFDQGDVPVRARNAGIAVEDDPVRAQDASFPGKFDIATGRHEIALAVEVDPVRLEDERLPPGVGGRLRCRAGACHQAQQKKEPERLHRPAA